MKNPKRMFAVLLSSALGLISSVSAAPPAASTGIDVIWAYAGVWKVEIEHLDTAQSKASHETTNLRNACWKDGGYLACNQYVDGESKALIVFTYNAKDNTYTSYPIPLGGGPSGQGKLMIEGNTWTFPWQVKDGDKTTYFRVVNVFEAPDRIRYRQEFSSDQVNWTITAKGLETKISGQ
ncbi:MAG: hypothetical protein WBQ94_23190 [Terracidiphilus sp.]